MRGMPLSWSAPAGWPSLRPSLAQIGRRILRAGLPSLLLISNGEPFCHGTRVGGHPRARFPVTPGLYAVGMAFLCSSCGFSSPRWAGFCSQCRAQEPLAETGSGVHSVVGVGEARVERLVTGVVELDRVLGGGLIPGSAVLLGGEPGIGKSTLLLQVADALSSADAPTLLATAEESVQQIGLRADRLGCGKVSVVAEDSVGVIVEHSTRSKPAVLIVDSIQTVNSPANGGVLGGINQVRESAARLVRHAKESGCALVLVGHVTKDGAIAGPKQLEHLVDVVLSLEGEPELGLRVLRSQKNRFGATHQVGLFQMTERGLIELQESLLGEWWGDVPGTVAFAGVEGRRSLLVEVQALVAPSSTSQPRRRVKGVGLARVHQLLAVLERHAGFSFGQLDVFVNLSGGFRVREPAADLPVALALVSSLLGTPLGRTAAWGEVGLTGQVRTVPHLDRRLQEVERMGLKVVAPSAERVRIEELLLDAGLVPGVPGPVVASRPHDGEDAQSDTGVIAALSSGH